MRKARAATLGQLRERRRADGANLLGDLRPADALGFSLRVERVVQLLRIESKYLRRPDVAEQRAFGDRLFLTDHEALRRSTQPAKHLQHPIRFGCCMVSQSAD